MFIIRNYHDAPSHERQIPLNNSENVHIVLNACCVMHATFKSLIASTPGNDKVPLKHVGYMKSTIITTGGSN